MEAEGNTRIFEATRRGSRKRNGGTMK